MGGESYAEIGKTSEDYHIINSDFHRGVPKKISPPALTWTLGFWIERQESFHDEFSKFIGERNDFKKSLDGMICELAKVLCDVAEELTIRPSIEGRSNKKAYLFSRILDGVECNFNASGKSSSEPEGESSPIFLGSSRSIELSFKIGGVSFSKIFDVATDYFTITTYAEISDINYIDGRFSKLKKALIDVSSYIDEKGEDHDNVGVESEYLFRVFWREYWLLLTGRREDGDVGNEFFNVYNEQRKYDPNGKGGILSKNLFADFKGIILSIGDSGPAFGNEFFSSKKSSPPCPVVAPQWGESVLIRLKNIVGKKGDSVIDSPEYCANYIENGMALYISQLAPHAIEQKSRSRIPVEFIVYAKSIKESEKDEGVVRDGLSEWQIGRIVNSINRCGIYRLATLRDNFELHEAARKISYFDLLVNRARENINNASVKSGENVRSIDKALKTFNEIGIEFAKKRKYGLVYRMTQARNSIKKFRYTVQGLGIIPLHPAVPYDVFVERRLGSEFDFIERLGTRYERAAETSARLNETLIAIETKELSGRLCSMQHAAELALVVVLIPYYLTRLLLEHNDGIVLPEFSGVLLQKYSGMKIDGLIHPHVGLLKFIIWVGIVALYKFGRPLVKKIWTRK